MGSDGVNTVSSACIARLTWTHMGRVAATCLQPVARVRLVCFSISVLITDVRTPKALPLQAQRFTFRNRLSAHYVFNCTDFLTAIQRSNTKLIWNLS